MQNLTYANPSQIAGNPGLPGPLCTSSGMSPEARDGWLLEHLPVVRSIARRIHERLPQHVELDDLVSSGVIGLIDAAAKFDGSKNIQFTTYAQFRIRGAILDSLRKVDWGSRELRRRGRQITEAIQALSRRLERHPTEEEIASELDLPLSEYQSLLGDLKGLEIGTLHVEHHEGSGEDEIAFIAGSEDEDPYFLCLRGEMRTRLAEAIASLPERERLVLTLYYYEELTLKEIGVTLGLVQSRICQIRSSAILHLRALLSARSAKALARTGRA